MADDDACKIDTNYWTNMHLFEVGSTNATEATTIFVQQPGKNEPTTVADFKPVFTYSIFGDEESIFGYQDLKISINFAAHDLYPNIHWTSGKRFNSVGVTEALDIRDALTEFAPACGDCVALLKPHY